MRLWVDNSLVIDQWTSLAATEASGTILFGLGNEFYDITLEYAAQASRVPFVRLSMRRSAVCGRAQVDATCLQTEPLRIGSHAAAAAAAAAEMCISAMQAPGTSDSGLSLKWENSNTQVGLPQPQQQRTFLEDQPQLPIGYSLPSALWSWLVPGRQPHVQGRHSHRSALPELRDLRVAFHHRPVITLNAFPVAVVHGSARAARAMVTPEGNYLLRAVRRDSWYDGSKPRSVKHPHLKVGA